MHLWLAHTRHPCKCKHPLSTLKSIWLYMHRGNHTHLEAFVCVYNAQLFHLFWELHLNVHFTRIQTNVWFCINRLVNVQLVKINKANWAFRGFKNYFDLWYSTCKHKSIIKGYTDVLCLWQTCQAMDWNILFLTNTKSNCLY